MLINTGEQKIIELTLEKVVKLIDEFKFKVDYTTSRRRHIESILRKLKERIKEI